MTNAIRRNVFDDLFVLELANNHWGRVERGIQIIREFGRVVRYNNVRAALKLQIRDIDTFIHPAFRDRADVRYIKKTMDTRISRDELAVLAEEVRKNGMVRMATPFDERSVQTCVDLGVEILKLASSDVNDWMLIEAIAKTRKPVIASTGGTSLKDTDDLVTFFANRGIPLALNHCVSLYPTEDAELELNQIDFLRDRYPHVTIGFSTHEKGDWRYSVAIAYAKGARTFERHVDIDADGIPVSPYCSTPDQVDEWFRAFRKVKEMCGAPGTQKRIPGEKEIRYLDALLRGVYAGRDLPAGYALSDADVVLQVPLQKGQLSCRELIGGMVLSQPLKAGEALTVDHVEGSYSHASTMRAIIQSRGL